MAVNLGIFCKELILGLVAILVLYKTFRIINDNLIKKNEKKKH